MFLRSPTAEQAFGNRADPDVASAGLNADADVPCTLDLVDWADVIFVVARAPRQADPAIPAARARVICLAIADDPASMDPALVALLHARVGRRRPMGARRPAKPA